MSKSSVESKVTVNIFGDEYPIIGVGDSSYISQIADYVDSKMKEVAKSSRVVSRDKVAILAAMSIASELYENKDSMKLSKVHINSKIDNILNRLELALTDK
ncbi:MAG: cell division protein ZapA [Candidatus Zixiibacteriota bacterium]